MSRHWEREIESLIRGKVADARAHADAAITAKLKATPDGRKTARAASWSRSMKAALKRLDELLDELVGPSEASLQGWLRDAREASYLETYHALHPAIPLEFRARRNPEPTRAMLDAARGLVLHGYTLRAELAGPIQTAKRTLAGAVVQAAAVTARRSTEVDVLKAWETKAADAIVRAALTAHADAAVAFQRLAGRDLIKPELLEV